VCYLSLALLKVITNRYLFCFLFILNAILNNSWILSIAEMQLKIETSCVPVLYDVDPSLHTEKFKHEPGKVYLWKNISLDLMQEISKIHSSLRFLYIFLKNMWCFIVFNYHIIKFWHIVCLFDHKNEVPLSFNSNYVLVADVFVPSNTLSSTSR
jgi:hypothetical protein